MAEWYEHTREQLAELSGLSLRRLEQISTKLPEDQRFFEKTGGTLYDARVFFSRYHDYLKMIGDGGDTLEEVKKEHEKVKMKKSEIELLRMRGSLIHRDDVERAWTRIFIVFRDRMLHVPVKVAPLVTAETKTAKIRDVLDREIREALETLSETEIGFEERDLNERENADDSDGNDAE